MKKYFEDDKDFVAFCKNGKTLEGSSNDAKESPFIFYYQ